MRIWAGEGNKVWDYNWTMWESTETIFVYEIINDLINEVNIILLKKERKMVLLNPKFENRQKC